MVELRFGESVEATILLLDDSCHLSIKYGQLLLKWKGCDYNGSEYKINIGTFYWWGPTVTHPRLPVQFTCTYC